MFLKLCRYGCRREIHDSYREHPSSIFNREDDMCLFVVLLRISKKILQYSLERCHKHFFHVISNSSFTVIHISSLYASYAVEKASWNRLRNNVDLRIELTIPSIYIYIYTVKSDLRAHGVEVGITTFLTLNAYITTFYVVKTIWRKRRF